MSENNIHGVFTDDPKVREAEIAIRSTGGRTTSKPAAGGPAAPLEARLCDPSKLGLTDEHMKTPYNDNTDRRLTLHVLKDGRVRAVVTCPSIDMAVSAHTFTQGWRYLLGRGELLARVTREWADLRYQIIVTFET